METPDPPKDTPEALKQVVLTPHDIPWSFREQHFLQSSFQTCGNGSQGYNSPTGCSRWQRNWTIHILGIDMRKKIQSIIQFSTWNYIDHMIIWNLSIYSTFWSYHGIVKHRKSVGEFIPVFSFPGGALKSMGASIGVQKSERKIRLKSYDQILYMFVGKAFIEKKYQQTMDNFLSSESLFLLAKPCSTSKLRLRKSRYLDLYRHLGNQQPANG